MKWYLLFSAVWTYCFLLLPLAFYVGYYGMATITDGPRWFAVWLGNRRVLQSMVAFHEVYEISMVRKLKEAT